MNNKEKLTKKIIEAIHGLTYEEAIIKELPDCFKGYKNITPHMTIGRVMQALGKTDKHYCYGNGVIFEDSSEYGKNICEWKLAKKNGKEAILDDQSEETINKLLELFIG